MSLVILFYFLCTQHVSDISISIIRSLRLCCWITTLVVLFLFRCVLEIWRDWVWVVSVLQAEACNTDTTLLVFYSSAITMMHGPINISNNFFKTPLIEVRNSSHHTLLNIIYAKTYFAVEPIFVSSAGMPCTVLRYILFTWRILKNVLRS